MDSRLISWAICAAIAGVIVWFGFWVNTGPASHSAAEAQIRAMLTRSLTENDPVQCTQDMTPAFRRRQFGDGSANPLAKCRDENTDGTNSLAKEVQFESVSVQGATAHAVIEVSGSSLDGSVLGMDLVLDGSRWKVDRLASIQIDRPRMDGAIEQEASVKGITSAQAPCLVDALDRTYSDAQLEQTLLAGGKPDTGSAAYGCMGRATLLRSFEKGVVHSLSSRDVPRPVSECIFHRLTDGLSLAQLRNLVRGAAAHSFRLGDQARGAALICAAAYGARQGAAPPAAATGRA